MADMRSIQNPGNDSPFSGWHGGNAGYVGAGGDPFSSGFTSQSTYQNVTVAYEAMAHWVFWSEPVFQALATKKGEQITHTGAAVQFNKKNNLQPTRTPLGETDDVVGQRGNDETITVYMQEYGDAVQLTSLVRAWSMWSVEADMAFLLSRQMRDSVELITLDAVLKTRNRYRHGLPVESLANAAAITALGTQYAAGLDAGTDLRQGAMIEQSEPFLVERGGTAATNSNPLGGGLETTAGDTDGAAADADAYGAAFVYDAGARTIDANAPIAGATMDLELLRRIVADMRTGSVPNLSMGCYVAFLHPNQTLDLIEKDGVEIGTMVSHQVRNRPADFEQGMLTKVAGVQFVESPRVPIIRGNSGRAATVAADSIPDIYLSPVFGADAIAKAYPDVPGYGEWPSMMASPQIDKLMRFRALAWYGLFGVAPFRGNALSIAETTCTNSLNM